MSAGDLKKFALFVEFTEEDRTALDELLEPETITAGRTLFCEGNEASFNESFPWTTSSSAVDRRGSHP